MEKESYKLILAPYEPGYVFGCAKCRKILRQGTWAVGLLIGNHKYMVGCNPPVTCCGEEKKVGQVFDTEKEADAFADRIQETLNREGTTTSLVLYEFAVVQSTANH